VLLDIHFDPADASERAAYAALAEKIAVSLQPGVASAKAQATRPATQP